jgi:spermidine synthase
LPNSFFRKSTAESLDDTRVMILQVDAFDYIKNTTEMYNVIISDHRDTTLPGYMVFQPELYEMMYKALNKWWRQLCTSPMYMDQLGFD